MLYHCRCNNWFSMIVQSLFLLFMKNNCIKFLYFFSCLTSHEGHPLKIAFDFIMKKNVLTMSNEESEEKKFLPSYSLDLNLFQ